MKPRCRLKPIRNPEGIRTWCGPVAMSIITGNRIEWCARRVAAWRNKTGDYRRKQTAKMVKGVYNIEMEIALGKMGYEMIRIRGPRGMTLRQWINSYSSEHHRAICLVNVTDHYVVTHLGQVADNKKPKGCQVDDHPCRRWKIKHAWIVRRRKKS